MRNSLYLAVLIRPSLLLSTQSVEIFRYEYKCRDGSDYEAVFETDEKKAPNPVEKTTLSRS
jgi:hypothetical protein